LGNQILGGKNIRSKKKYFYVSIEKGRVYHAGEFLHSFLKTGIKFNYTNLDIKISTGCLMKILFKKFLEIFRIIFVIIFKNPKKIIFVYPNNFSSILFNKNKVVSKIFSKFWSFIFWLINKKKFETGIFVFDLPPYGGKRNSENLVWLEKIIFNSVDKIFVPSKKYALKSKIILDNSSKIVEFILYDHLDYSKSGKFIVSKFDVKNLKIVFSANLTKDRISLLDILNLPYLKSVTYYITGPNGDWLHNKLKTRKDIIYLGLLRDAELEKLHKKCDFGLIIYSGDFHNYFKYLICGKLTTYINHCLPVITLDNYIGISEFVKNQNIGISFKSIEEIKEIDKYIDLEYYKKMVENQIILRESIQKLEHYSLIFDDGNRV